ncbi:MAG: arylsulfatase [Rubrivivax sp.]|nr:arylsulfatase [Rubrivivax sp.]MBK7261391.1 arylsulfatase [Rubrivivax sp.]MBK8529552.1 arylsulfatase [Rubrivivax sp.]
MPRIALIHALAHSPAPINEALARSWPQAQRMNLLDDSLSADLAASGGVADAAMHQRFQDLAAYAVGCGAQAILFTCSAFGSCIDAVAKRLAPMPVLKPNEAMVAEAERAGGRIGLLASFAPTLQSMPSEFSPATALHCELAADAMDALNHGDTDTHDRVVVAAALRLRQRGVDRIALAQFSLARAAGAVREATGLPVLTTVDSAVAELRARLG